MAPELPATFSTTTGWPQAWANLSANRRAVTSVALPGVKPTTSLTGFSGHLVSAASGWTANAAASAASAPMSRCMVSSLVGRLLDFGFRCTLPSPTKLGRCPRSGRRGHRFYRQVFMTPPSAQALGYKRRRRRHLPSAERWGGRLRPGRDLAGELGQAARQGHELARHHDDGHGVLLGA